MYRSIAITVIVNDDDMNEEVVDMSMIEQISGPPGTSRMNHSEHTNQQATKTIPNIISLIH